jgi:fluoride exporter
MGEPRSVKLIATTMPRGRKAKSPNHTTTGTRYHVCMVCMRVGAWEESWDMVTAADSASSCLMSHLYAWGQVVLWQISGRCHRRDQSIAPSSTEGERIDSKAASRTGGVRPRTSLRLTTWREYGTSAPHVADTRSHPRSTDLPGISLIVSEVRNVAYLLIGIGGFLDANARYVVAEWVTERLGASFPYGTVVINVSGSFILGFFLIFISERLSVHPNLRLFFAIGFLGAYTTCSTFSFENFALLQERSYLLALANMLGSVALGLMAVVAGIIVARLF